MADAPAGRDYRETVFLPDLPGDPFPLRAGLPKKEPERVKHYRRRPRTPAHKLGLHAGRRDAPAMLGCKLRRDRARRHAAPVVFLARFCAT